MKGNRRNVGNRRRFSGGNAGRGMPRRKFMETAAAGLGGIALGATVFGKGGMSNAATAASPHATVGLNSEYAFELLAAVPIGQSTYSEKEAAIEEAIAMLKAKINSTADVRLVGSEDPYDWGLGDLADGFMDPLDDFFYGRGNYYGMEGHIWRDYNMKFDMDWENERETGRAVTVSFPADEGLLKAAGPSFALMLPWTISVFSGLLPKETLHYDYTGELDYDYDCIYVIAQVPETFVRIYMRDAVNYRGWMGVANSSHRRIRDLVRDTFSPAGWITDINDGFLVMDEEMIAALEDKYKFTLDKDTIAHSAEIGPIDTYLPEPNDDTLITVDNVVKILVRSIIAGEAYFDTDDIIWYYFHSYLNNCLLVPTDPFPWPYPYPPSDHSRYPFVYTCAEPETPFPWEALEDLIEEASHDAWDNDMTMLKFEGVRILDFSTNTMKLKIIEMCQPFYGHTALSLGFHHAPTLPDTFAVFEENGSVWLKAFNINFLFPYFWNDVVMAIDALPEDHIYRRLFPVFLAFPSILNNEVGTIVNRKFGPDTFPVDY